MMWMIFIKIFEHINQIKKQKALMVFDNMIHDMFSKKLNPVVTELFIRGKILNISLDFITFYLDFAVPESIKLNSSHYFIMTISNKREIQQIVLSHSGDIDFKGYMNLYKKTLHNHIHI